MNETQTTTHQLIAYADSLSSHGGYLIKLTDIAREITGAPRTCPFTPEAAACVLLADGWTVAKLRTRWS